MFGFIENKGYAEVEVSFSPVIPLVKINNDTLPLRSYYEGIFSYWDFLEVTYGDSINLNVDYTKDTATASVVIPGRFEITSHDTSQIAYIPLYSDFTVKWSSSAQKRGYWVYFWIWYEYVTPQGFLKEYEFECDTFLTSNSITFPSSKLFPPGIFEVIWSDGYFSVYALNGPEIKPGVEGNINGGGTGFFWGITFGGELYVVIQETKTKVEKEKITREKLMKKLFEKVKRLDLNYHTLKESF
mgnify:CR=1 FL=1